MLAAAVIYVVGIVAGVITPNTVLTALSALAAVAGFIVAVVNLRDAKRTLGEADEARRQAQEVHRRAMLGRKGEDRHP